MNMAFDAVVYDLDGTLVDSAPVVCHILNALRQERGDPPLPQARFYDWISLGGEQLVGRALGLPVAEAGPMLVEFRRRYAMLPTPLDTVYPQVGASLELLRAAGVQLGICSNKPRRLVDKVLAETGLGAYFGSVVAGDDLPTRKPDAANLHACLHQLRVAGAATLYVGDSTVDQQCARNAGLPFAFFSGGYDDGVDPALVALSFAEHALLAGAIAAAAAH